MEEKLMTDFAPHIVSNGELKNIILELTQMIEPIPNFRTIEISAIAIQILAIFVTVFYQILQSKYYREKLRQEIRKNNIPTKWNREQTKAYKKRFCEERMTINYWKKRGPRPWYQDRKLKTNE